MNQDSGILSIPSELPINSGFSIRRKRSSVLISLYGVFTLLLIGSIMFWNVVTGIKIAIVPVLFFYIYRLFTKHLFNTHPLAIVQITLTDFNWCFVRYKNNKIIKADILPDSILTQYLVILNLQLIAEMPEPFQSAALLHAPLFSRCFKALFKNLSGRESVLFTRDSSAADVFRDLKRHLRCLNVQQTPEADRN